MRNVGGDGVVNALFDHPLDCEVSNSLDQWRAVVEKGLTLEKVLSRYTPSNPRTVKYLSQNSCERW